jgi:hypothetical protein
MQMLHEESDHSRVPFPNRVLLNDLFIHPHYLGWVHSLNLRSDAISGVFAFIYCSRIFPEFGGCRIYWAEGHVGEVPGE